MDARAYVLLDVTDSRPGDVARVLRSRPGVVKADLLEGPPDVIFVVEASNQQELVELTTQVLASVETMTEHLQLLPTRDGYNPHILREPSMLWTQNKLAESVNNMLRAQDKLVESIVEINQLLAVYHGGPVQDGLNKQTFLKPARRAGEE